MDQNERLGLTDMYVGPDLVLWHLSACSDGEAIRCLAERLLEAGILMERVPAAVLERERNFSTGLQFPAMGIALPHTDACHVIRPAVAIGILENPVTFRAMGMPDDAVKVQLVFLLAIAKAGAEAEFLARLIDAFQTPGCLEEIRDSASAEEAARVFRGKVFGTDAAQ